MAAASFFSSVAAGLLKDAPRRETELKEAAKALESTWKVGRDSQALKSISFLLCLALYGTYDCKNYTPGFIMYYSLRFDC